MYKVVDDKLAIVQIAVSNKNIVDAEAYAWLEFLWFYFISSDFISECKGS